MGCEDPILITPEDGWFVPGLVEFGARSVNGRYSLPAVMTNISDQVVTVQLVNFEYEEEIEPAFIALLAAGGSLRGYRLEVRESVDVDIVFEPRIEGRYDAEMRVSTVAGDARLSVTGLAVAEALPELELNPSAVTFAQTEVEAEAQPVPITIRNIGAEPGTIVQIQLGQSRMEARPGITPFYVSPPNMATTLRDVTIDGGESINAEVHYRPLAERVDAAELVFVLEEGEEARMSAQGSAVAAGDLDCAPLDIDFGTLTRGSLDEIVDINCTVRGGVYTVASVGLEAGASPRFIPLNLPVEGSSRSDGGVYSFGVAFSPTGLPAVHTGRLKIIAAHGATTEVSLTGRVDPPPVTATQLSIRVGWQTFDTDMDLHLVRNGAMPFNMLNDCHWRAKNPDWGNAADFRDDPFLDRDAEDGIGPETINMTMVREQIYDVFVHYNDRTVAPPAQNTVTTSVYLNGSLAAELSHDLNNCGDMWYVGRVDYGPVQPTFTTVDQISDYTPQASCPP